MAAVSATPVFIGLDCSSTQFIQAQNCSRIVQVMAVAPILHVSATNVGMENFATALFLLSTAIQTLVCKVVTAMEVVTEGVCVCDPRWTGPHCDFSEQQFTQRGRPNNCSSRGTCVNASRICDPDFVGVDCSDVFPLSSNVSCFSNCNGHGVCFGTIRAIVTSDGKDCIAKSIILSQTIVLAKIVLPSIIRI